jgi:hypothetical protein
MNRAFALIGALLLSSLSIASTCVAEAPDRIGFTLQDRGGSEGIHANFRSDGRSSNHEWSSGFRSNELVGLDLAGFRASDAHALRFSLIRDAGRLDCAGNGGGGLASGNCSFTPDRGFAQLLESRGIARPKPGQGIGLMAVNVRRELIDAIAAARYPTPTIGDLMSMSALGIDGGFVRGMAGAGYRPGTLNGLIQFKALDITPQWIGGFIRIGYGDLAADQLVQLKAMGITADYVAGFERLGYHRLPVEKLVQLKAMDITPEFVRSVAAGRAMPDPDKLVALRIFGDRR